MTDKYSTEKGIEDSVEGKAKDLKGKVKDSVGGLTGDTGLQVEGKFDQLEGKAQDRTPSARLSERSTRRQSRKGT